MSILIIAIILLIYFSIKKPEYGLATYFVIRLCIPLSARFFFISFNTLSLVLLILLVIPTLIQRIINLSKIQKKFIKILGTLIGVLLLLCFLPTVVPLNFQLSKICQFIITELLPAVLVILLIRKQKEFEILCHAILWATLFTAIYGIFTFATQSNPLYLLFAVDESAVVDVSRLERAGISGYSTGIYNDAIFLSLISLLLFIFLFNKYFLPQKILGVTLILTLVDLFLTTKRSAFVCVIIFFLVLLYDPKYKKLIRKIFILGGAFAIMGIIFIPQLDGIRDMLLSSILFWDDNLQRELGTTGSSMEMRFNQFSNVFFLIKDYILQGMGYNFAEYYYTEIFDSEIYGLDPDYLGFESYILKIATSSGLIGLCIWGITFFHFYIIMQNRKSLKKYRYFQAFTITYLIAIIMTDSSGSLYLFLSFVALNAIYSRIYIDNTQLNFQQ